MDTILLVVNESSVAVRAATIAADLAAGMGARLVAVSVVDGVRSPADAVRALQRRAQSLGRELGVHVDVVTLHGDGDDELVQHAAAVGADLVVIGGTAERPGSFGRTAERILAAGRAPVLVVPLET